MIKNVIGGIAIGIANIIPGVSGGTMMVILGIFNRMMEAISGLFLKNNPNRKDDFLFILEVLIGAAIGLVGFAKILTFLFNTYPTQTMYWFVGLVGFSIPVFMKSESKNNKLNWIALVCGLAIILIIKFLAPQSDGNFNPVFPPIEVMYCIKMIFVGIIGGAAMILPGVSGSMVLMIIGEYFLFKSLLANVLSFELIVLVPLFFLGIGILIGIVLSAKLAKYFLTHYHVQTISFLLGLIIMSTFVLIPFSAEYSLGIILSSLLAFLLGGLIVRVINHFA